jgi:hypothetical protein
LVLIHGRGEAKRPGVSDVMSMDGSLPTIASASTCPMAGENENPLPLQPVASHRPRASGDGPARKRPSAATSRRQSPASRVLGGAMFLPLVAVNPNVYAAAARLNATGWFAVLTMSVLAIFVGYIRASNRERG